ncbi:YceD family protein [Scleromatobacter humisilvae]|uniref:Large ribosomal RNA subunit accumulation protein YceD n=1 Tax=Scleromatobacter humisilvae TaxID=2897159 RepID=A0A9X2C405_9BURK|nr:YceD family protein [Scleromatobacter humisilvae]MCK9688325.1 YceD family protein [Scleromatobacter humisilvae]
MTSPALDPLRLHVANFAADAQEAEGDWAIAELPRLADSECPLDAGSPIKAKADAPGLPPRSASDLGRRVRWHAVGSTRTVGGEDQIWLHLLAGADVILQCQRCLLPLDEAVHVDRHFRFVADEDTAAALDDESEDEILALPRTLNLRDLVEDEMLLALPLVPRHDVCPEAVPMQFGDVEIVEEEANPFASLALLRKDKDGDGGPDIV